MSSFSNPSPEETASNSKSFRLENADRAQDAHEEAFPGVDHSGNTEIIVSAGPQDLRIDPKFLDDVEEDDAWLSCPDELRLAPNDCVDESEYETTYESTSSIVCKPTQTYSYEDPYVDLIIDQGRLTPEDEPVERLWLTINKDLAIPIDRSGRLDVVNFRPLEPIAKTTTPELAKGKTLHALVGKVVESSPEELKKTSTSVVESRQEEPLPPTQEEPQSEQRVDTTPNNTIPEVVYATTCELKATPIRPPRSRKNRRVGPPVASRLVERQVEPPEPKSEPTPGEPDVLSGSTFEVVSEPPQETLPAVEPPLNVDASIETTSEPIAYPEEEQAEFDRAAAEFESEEEAAFQGDPAALCRLARRYEQGDYVPRDSRHAFTLYYRAALKGDAEAERALGTCYRWGVGVAPSRRHSFYWYRESARHGDVEARRQLGLAYANGWGTKPDLTRAARSFYLAAKGGDVLAEFAYGQALLYGRGVKRDVAKGLKRLKHASQRGLHAASLELLAWERAASGKELRVYERDPVEAGAHKRKKRRIDDFNVKDAAESDGETGNVSKNANGRQDDDRTKMVSRRSRKKNL